MLDQADKAGTHSFDGQSIHVLEDPAASLTTNYCKVATPLTASS